jgi:hypothetical protein
VAAYGWEGERVQTAGRYAAPVIPGQGAARLTRATVFAVSAVALAAAAHLAGGEPVSLTAALVAVPAVTGVTNLLARRRRGLPAVLTALAASQLVLHEAFMATAPQGGCHTGGEAMAGMAGMPGMGASVTVHCAAMAHQGWTATMLAGHAAATLLTALVLARGEAAIWALAQWLRGPDLPPVPHLRLPGRPARPRPRVLVPAAGRIPTPISRRGPPRTARSG